MKKILTAAAIVAVTMVACNSGTTTESATTTDTTAKPVESVEATEAQNRVQEISDSTKMLDKKLADPNSKYSPDSLK